MLRVSESNFTKITMKEAHTTEIRVYTNPRLFFAVIIVSLIERLANKSYCTINIS